MKKESLYTRFNFVFVIVRWCLVSLKAHSQLTNVVVEGVPERGEFPPIEMTTEYATAKGTSFLRIKVIPPPCQFSGSDELRDIVFQVGNSQSPYISSRLVVVETKQEILDKLASTEFLRELVDAVPDMEDSLRDV